MAQPSYCSYTKFSGTLETAIINNPNDNKITQYALGSIASQNALQEVTSLKEKVSLLALYYKALFYILVSVFILIYF